MSSSTATTMMMMLMTNRPFAMTPCCCATESVSCTCNSRRRTRQRRRRPHRHQHQHNNDDGHTTPLLLHHCTAVAHRADNNDQAADADRPPQSPSTSPSPSSTPFTAAVRSHRRVIGCVGVMLPLLLVLQLLGTAQCAAIVRKGSLLIPATYTAGSGDMHVQLHYDPRTVVGTLQDLRLQITRLDDRGRQTVALIDVYADPRSNVTQVTVPCQSLLLGGAHEFEIIGNDNEVLSATAVATGSADASTGAPDERLRRQLDIRWPVPKLSVTPESVGTYPEGPVDVILEFPGVECALRAGDVQNVPEFWLELFYCGHEVYCDSANVSAAQVLYREQVRGYPRLARIVKLRCELFGLAGHYVVKLRPIGSVLASVSATAFVKADWSEQFVFNVHARSITPCDPHTGIGVLFEYPACILDRADRVRLFAKLRADVASLAPPTTLHYVTEQRVVRGQHSLHFDCDLFSEKYIEYCFVYVSQAISGAVADIRMDCLPTLPVSDADVGGWGPWSDWTPCSTTCAGGTKNRYRVCDSPPPRYGAKFCQGDAVETRQCGGPVSGTWECMYGNNGYGSTGSGGSPANTAIVGQLPVDRPEVRAEIGPGCRCGCIVHLSVAKSRRLIASSAESCPGRTFWLIQADATQRIAFSVDFFRLACGSQYVRIRDGDSLASELIAEYVGGGGSEQRPKAGGAGPAVVVSTQSQILLEFYTNDLAVLGDECKGGFLIHAQQTEHPTPNRTATTALTAHAAVISALDPRPYALHNLTVVHITAILFAGVIIVVSAMLGMQYVFRYRKYQLAASQAEPDSPAHTPRASIDGSADFDPAADGDGVTAVRGDGVQRATSTTTLLSEVQSLIKMRPRLMGGHNKHQRLRESVDAEALAHAADGGADADGSKRTGRRRSSGDNGDNDDDNDGDNSAGAENASIVSSHTLTNETHAEDDDAGHNADTLKPSAKARQHQRRHLPVVARHSTATTMAVVTDDDDGLLSDAEPVSPNTVGSRSPDDADESSPTSSCSPPSPPHRHHSISSLPAATTLAKTRLLAMATAAKKTTEGRSETTASASNTDAETAASRASSTATTTLPPRKWLRDKHRTAGAAARGLSASVAQRHSDASSAATTAMDVQSVSGVGRSRKLSVGSAALMCRDGVGSSTASMAMLSGSANLTDSEAGSSMLRTRRLKKLHGRCYSPTTSRSQQLTSAASSGSTATLRSTTANKDSKEAQNRQKLLAGPGSEFSLANAEDFELDYYDYNVINAGAAPGSYLGMDPAYLVWIPPLDGGDIIQEMDDQDNEDRTTQMALEEADDDDGDNDNDDDSEPHYEEIRLPPHPQSSRSIHSIETASPSNEAPTLPPLNSERPSQPPQQHYASQMQHKNQMNTAISKVMAATALNNDASPNASTTGVIGVHIPLKELRPAPSPPSTHGSNKCVRRLLAQPSEEEKETAVLKSPEPPRESASSAGGSNLDDIQFADDEEDEDGFAESSNVAVRFVDNRSGTIRAANVAYYQPTARTSDV